MPGRRPRKADCTVDFTAGNVAVVVVSLFVHGDGVEWTMGVPGVSGASALVAPRSCFGNLPRGLRAAKFSGRGVRMLPDESSAPATAMLEGVVTLLGASLWVFSPRDGSG
jgi:hypothetical protein